MFTLAWAVGYNGDDLARWANGFIVCPRGTFRRYNSLHPLYPGLNHQAWYNVVMYEEVFLLISFVSQDGTQVARHKGVSR